MSPVKNETKTNASEQIPYGRYGIYHDLKIELDGCKLFLGSQGSSYDSGRMAQWPPSPTNVTVWGWNGTEMKKVAHFCAGGFVTCCGAMIVYDLCFGKVIKDGKYQFFSFDNGEFGKIVEEIARRWGYTCVLDVVPDRDASKMKAYSGGGFEDVLHFHNDRYSSGHELTLFARAVDGIKATY